MQWLLSGVMVTLLAISYDQLAEGGLSNNILFTVISLQFDSPFAIHQWSDGLFLVADYNNERLRLLDMTKKKVLPVCIGSTTNCTTDTSLSVGPTSLLISNNTVYVGSWSGMGIYKLVSTHALLQTKWSIVLNI